MTAALVVEGLSKRYRSRLALDDVSLQVAEGELVGLLGPNGAGKSTLVKSVCGLVRPTAGSATVLGAPAGSRTARRQIGYLAETFRYPAWATGGEVLQLHQRLTGSPGGATERRRLLALVGLDDAERLRVDAMSKGMQQRLGLAQSLVGSPRLLLLDEPTSALDPMGRRLVRSVLEQVRNDGVSVLLNSHLLSEVELVCDRVVILRRGEVVTEGRPADLEQPRGVEVETSAGTRLLPTLRRDEIPAMVARLVQDGEDVYAVRPLRSTLEDVYLEAVEGDVS